jgi:hypothetical protein
VMILSLGGFAGAIALQFLVPALSTVIFYVLILWIVASFFVYRLPAMSRTIGRPAPPRPASFSPAITPAFGPGSSPPTDLGFCAFCGTNVEPGTHLCPSCGRTLSPV